ncbi:MAG TPA: 2-C-methyl-D-erythritol 2,4-cyclodiphosphate synthase, partial [Acidimicrobiia bacterium]
QRPGGRQPGRRGGWRQRPLPVRGAPGWQVTHVDSTIVVEEIRISPHRESMRSKVGAALGIDASSVSVKATTTDGLGFIGRGEGLAAVAVVTVSALP